jgi:hypothetical protein
MKVFYHLVLSLLTLFLVWDAPIVDVDGNPVPATLIKEYRVYVKDTSLAPWSEPFVVAEPAISLEVIGLTNRRIVAVEAVSTSGDVSPKSLELERVQLGSAGKLRIEDR